MFVPEQIEHLTSEQVAEMFLWLDELRESGQLNMFGAAPHLAKQFDIPKQLARKVWTQWAETFAARHGSAE